jgi:MFS family permease
MFALAGIAAIPFVGSRVDRPGRPRLIAIGTLIMLASALGFLGVDRVGPLAITLRLAQGLAYSITFVVGAALAADMSTPERMSRTMGLYGSANLVTNAVAPAIAEPLMNVFGYRAVFVVSAVMAVVAFCFARRLTERPRAPAGPGRGGLGVVFRRWRSVRMMAAIGLAGVALGAMFTFSQPMALALGIDQMRGFFIAYTAGTLTVRFTLAGLADRVGPQRACVGSLVLYAAVVFAMRYLNVFGLALLGGAFGVAHGFLFPAAMALSVSGLPAEERGRMLTLTNGAFIGGTVAVMPLGVVAARLGYPMVFTLSALGALAGAALLARWPVASAAAPHHA